MYPICPCFDSDHGELLGDESFLHVGCSRHICGDECLVALLPWAGQYRLGKLEMEFNGPDSKLVVLRGMHSYPPQIVSTYRMEVDLRHGDIE